MPPPAIGPDWDIFCNVIDNYGDIGICWRLARQLAKEHGLRVRLWVDELDSFQALCPRIDPAQDAQQAMGVEVRHWPPDFAEVLPGDVVIEAFGCRVPENFVLAMAQRNPRPVWINLEYLSAEAWVESCHTLSSPHPRLPLTKYFFFPGFTARTGGLLRENDLLARRRRFEQSPELQAEFWQASGFPPPNPDALRVSLFAYENPAIADLLRAWEKSDTPICCLLPVSRALPTVEAFCAHPLKAGDRRQCGALDIRVIPFSEQARYDALLWACDLNFVRGEDSFVRAQWAARPMIWHIYPQEEAAHLAKLDAFLDRYCADLPSATATVVRQFSGTWNTGRLAPTHWNELAAHLPALRRHAIAWAEKLAERDDLSSALVHFCRSKV